MSNDINDFHDVAGTGMNPRFAGSLQWNAINNNDATTSKIAVPPIPASLNKKASVSTNANKAWYLVILLSSPIIVGIILGIFGITPN